MKIKNNIIKLKLLINAFNKKLIIIVYCILKIKYKILFLIKK